MQESEGKPVTPGQWMEQNTEVLVPGLMIFLAMLVTTEGAGAMGTGVLVLVTCCCCPPRGVMEIEEGWD